MIEELITTMNYLTMIDKYGKQAVIEQLEYNMKQGYLGLAISSAEVLRILNNRR